MISNKFKNITTKLKLTPKIYHLHQTNKNQNIKIKHPKIKYNSIKQNHNLTLNNKNNSRLIISYHLAQYLNHLMIKNNFQVIIQKINLI
jgi:hypothetical protein